MKTKEDELYTLSSLVTLWRLIMCFTRSLAYYSPKPSRQAATQRQGQQQQRHDRSVDMRWAPGVWSQLMRPIHTISSQSGESPVFFRYLNRWNGESKLRIHHPLDIWIQLLKSTIYWQLA